MKKNSLLALCLILLTVQSFSQQKFRSGIFLHHSTGRNIWGPNESSTSVPEEIATYNTNHGYSGDEECSLNEKWFPSNHGNEWADWHHLFDKDYSDDDVWQYISSNKIVVIKSCFPSSAMTGRGDASDTIAFTTKSVYNYKWHWRHIIRIMESHPENFFVIWTNAPLVAGATNDNQAYWSHVFCTWAKDTLAEGNDPVYGAFPKNVYVFDYFHKLAGDDHKEKPEYAKSNTDSHPNSAATELVAPQFVQEIFDAAIAYEAYYNGDLQPPVLISPANQSADIDPDTVLIWHSAGDTVQYHLQVSCLSDFSTTLVDTTLSDTVFFFNVELNSDTKYYWRVKVMTTGKESDWSEVWEFTTENTTGIERKQEDDLLVYPNPSRGIIHIRCNTGGEGNSTISLFNSRGQLMKVFRVPQKESTTLDISRYPAGVYYLKIGNGRNSEIKKIVIE